MDTIEQANALAIRMTDEGHKHMEIMYTIMAGRECWWVVLVRLQRIK